MASWRRVNLKFQAKVLIPVVTVMVLFLAGTMWLVNSRIQTQLQSENQLALRNTEALFATNFQRRADGLVQQFSAIPPRSDFFSLAQKFNVDDRETARARPCRNFSTGRSSRKPPSRCSPIRPANGWPARPTAFRRLRALVKSVLEKNAPDHASCR
jgi:hypothetical protein